MPITDVILCIVSDKLDIKWVYLFYLCVLKTFFAFIDVIGINLYISLLLRNDRVYRHLSENLFLHVFVQIGNNY